MCSREKQDGIELKHDTRAGFGLAIFKKLSNITLNVSVGRHHWGWEQLVILR